MKWPLIDILLADGTARAVCWTLVHSLWEGLLAALLAGLIILATRKRSAALRYNLLATDLLLFMLIAGATFFYETSQDGHSPAPGTRRMAVEMTGSGPNGGHSGKGSAIRAGNRPNSATVYNVAPATNMPGYLRATPGLPATENLLQRVSDYLNTHARVVTLIWLACLSGQMLRLTLGLYQVRRLRQNSTRLPGRDWNERLSVLAQRLGIKRTVTLLQSVLVKAPSALGFLKPSILVPMGMLANLPPDQVETILLHELAHIRRGDYAANLLLHLTEAIFFFNPGIRWVATWIRQEREACCDDIVLAGIPDKNSYFEALLAFKQWVIDGSLADGRSFTLQLGGGKTDLLWRIRRMLERENKKLQIMEKAILSFGLMALVTVSLISMKQREGDGGQPTAETIQGKVKAAVQRTVRNTVQVQVATTDNNVQNLERQVALIASANHVPAMATTHIPTTPATHVRPSALSADTIPNEQSSPSPGQTRTFPSFTIHTDSHDGRPIRTSSATDDQGNRYELRMVDGQIAEFKVNGRLVAKEDYGKYADFFGADEERQKAPLRPLQPLTPEQSVLGLQGSMLGLQRQSVLGLQQSMQGFRQSVQGFQQSMQEFQQFRKSIEGLKRSMPVPPEAPGAAEIGEGYSGAAQYKEAFRRYEEAARRYEEAQRRYRQAIIRYQDKLRQLEPGMPARPIAPETGIIRPMHPEQAPTLSSPLVFTNHPNPFVQKIVAELIESKLIDRVDQFSISLDANGMMINGVRQPDDVFAKYKTRYLRHANDHIIYSQYYRNDDSGTHCDVNIEDTAPGQTIEN
jgi:beta-lactamase regulating signal transducer with metallopeptidase domain/prefoldin subunit 5